MIHRNRHLRFSRTPLVIRLFIPLIALAALIAPANFVLITPGPVTDLFPDVLSIKENSGITSHPVNGDLFLLTIYVTNPETKVFGVEVLGCWVWGDCVALPRSVMYERDTNDKKERAAGKADMVKSQSTALTAAKGAIARNFPEVSLTTMSDSAINVSLKNTGGPSGGLIFTLGLIDLLTPEDLLKGRSIAGTGTISANGVIGAIGGVTEKIIGAKRAGAELLFISQENCLDLPEKVEGISIVAVRTIDEAISYLQKAPEKANSAGIRGCASVGA